MIYRGLSLLACVLACCGTLQPHAPGQPLFTCAHPHWPTPLHVLQANRLNQANANILGGATSTPNIFNANLATQVRLLNFVECSSLIS
jgi:hypothetical protein